MKDCPEICLGHVDISQFKTVDIELQGQQDVDTEIKIGRYFKLSVSTFPVYRHSHTEVTYTIDLYLVSSIVNEPLASKTFFCNFSLALIASVWVRRMQYRM